MRRPLLFLATFAATLAALDRTDNPPPTAAELHAARTSQALASAEAQIARTRVVVHWIGTN